MIICNIEVEFKLNFKRANEDTVRSTQYAVREKKRKNETEKLKK